MKNTFFLILGLALILGSVFLFFKQNPELEKETRTLEINGVSIKVEVADTPEAVRQGLSDRMGLSEGMGMFFILDKADYHGFWMKDMHFAIDIVWIDENFRVVGIEKEVSPETFPQVFRSDQPVKYVLELPAGYSDRHGIGVGAVIQ